MQMASRVTFWLFQWRAMGSSWSDRSRLMKPGNMVWVLSTAVGTMAHSTAMAEITGSATVSEQRPRHEISWILAIRFMRGSSVCTIPYQCSTSGGFGQGAIKTKEPGAVRRAPGMLMGMGRQGFRCRLKLPRVCTPSCIMKKAWESIFWTSCCNVSISYLDRQMQRICTSSPV